MTQSIVKLTDKLEEREWQIGEFVTGLETEIRKGLESGIAQAIEPASELIANFRKNTIPA